MKIAFDGQLFLAAEKTGIAWNAHHLLMELLKHPEHEYILQCFKGKRTVRQMRGLEEYALAGCRIECCKWFSLTIYKLIWMILPMPHRLFFRTKPDITQFFNYAVPPGVRGKRVTFVYDMVYRSYPQTVDKRTRRWLNACMKKSCRHADHILTISEFSKREIQKYTRIKDEQITVIPCAVDHAVYHPHYTKEQIQSVLTKYKIEPPYFLYLGTIEPRKNLERLIGAYARLCADMGQQKVPQLVLAGKRGWLCEGIYEKVHTLHMEQKILFTGYVAQEDSPVLMCGAKAFLFPSLYEGFGMPPLEAMACGTPVIVSNTTSLPEVVGNAGILVSPKSEKEICQAMERILTDVSERERLARLGIERAKEYTWEKSAQMLLDVYSSIQ